MTSLLKVSDLYVHNALAIQSRRKHPRPIFFWTLISLKWEEHPKNKHASSQNFPSPTESLKILGVSIVCLDVCTKETKDIHLLSNIRYSAVQDTPSRNMNILSRAQTSSFSMWCRVRKGIFLCYLVMAGCLMLPMYLIQHTTTGHNKNVCRACLTLLPPLAMAIVSPTVTLVFPPTSVLSLGLLRSDRKSPCALATIRTPLRVQPSSGGNEQRALHVRERLAKRLLYPLPHQLPVMMLDNCPEVDI